MKRVIFAFFAFVLGVGIFPIQSFAAEGVGMSGDGSAGNPYVIMTLEQLDAVRNDLTAHYVLGMDIDASKTSNWNDGSGFAPIGSYASDGNSHPFAGVFDGQGHEIRNLTINWPDNNSTGLFAFIGDSGVVRNVGLKGGMISGGQIIIPYGAFAKPFYLTIHHIKDRNQLTFTDEEQITSQVVEFTKDVPGDFEKDITVCLQFDSTVLRKEYHELRLARFDGSAKKWVYTDQMDVDWEKGTSSGTTRQLSKFVVMVKPKKLQENKGAVQFTDITGHWAQKYIEELALKGAVTGYSDGSFKPNQNISRAEFAVMLVRALGLATQVDYTFSDTKKHWAKDFVATAYAAGITQGYTPNEFAPDDTITREQMAVMAVKALKLEDVASPKTFTDQSKIGAWARKGIIAAVSHGLIQGYTDDTIRPQTYATRAEAITLIWRLLEQK